jgi:hypothetical protein
MLLLHRTAWLFATPTLCSYGVQKQHSPCYLLWAATCPAVRCHSNPSQQNDQHIAGHGLPRCLNNVSRHLVRDCGIEVICSAL